MGDQDIQRYEQMLADDPGSRVFAPLADAYRKANRLDEAIRVARAGLRHNPHYSGGLVVLGRALFEKGEISPALEAIQKAVDEAPENYLAQKTLAKISMEQGENARALRALQAAILLSPEDMEIQSDIENLQGKVTHPGSINFSSYDLAEEPSAPPEPQEPGMPDLEPLSEGIGSADSFQTPGPEAAVTAVEVSDMELPEFLSDLSALTNPSTEDIRDIDIIPEAVASPDVVHPDEQPSSPAAEDEIFTETLADLYAQQGAPDEAAHIYEQLLDEKPADEEINEKLRSVEEHQTGRAASGPAADVPGPAAEFVQGIPEAASPLENRPGSSRDPLQVLTDWLDKAERMKSR